ncbi:MAG: hypothetical protein KDE45_00335 [Caldilineaceae bacterium]|nr:hypothetical protein [Caldilineaceae bacterium]
MQKTNDPLIDEARRKALAVLSPAPTQAELAAAVELLNQHGQHAVANFLAMFRAE